MRELTIRPQNFGTDPAAITRINIEAFGEETPSFQKLREIPRDDLLSLVAERGGDIVGHVFFCPVSVNSSPPLDGMGLGQLAVRPDCQRQGIGAELTRTGLGELAARGCPYVIVIGVPAYYPRLGFEPGAQYGLRCQWQVPPESFMVQVLNRAALAGVSGVASYRDV
jgi:putative acetyltransferase